MPSQDITEAELLEATLSFLQSRLSIDDDSSWISVYTSLPKLPVSTPDEGFSYIISPIVSQPEESLYEGGAEEQFVDLYEFAVTIVTRLHLDETDRDTDLLLHPDLGLMAGKRKVLWAFSGQMLGSVAASYLREVLRPTGSTTPQSGTISGEDPEGPSLPGAWLTVNFAAPFDWNLYQ